MFAHFHPVEAVAAAVRRPLRTVDEVRYRQEVFRDLAEPGSRRAVETFAQRVRGALDLADAATASHYEVSANRVHLHAVAEYVAAIDEATQSFRSFETKGRLSSRALTESCAALQELQRSAPFRSLADESARLVELLDDVRAEVGMRGARFVISPARDDLDVADDAGNVFARFRDPDQHPDGRSDMQVPRLDMDHVQEWVLDDIARLHPQVFDRLAAFRRNTVAFVHPGVSRMVEELVFFRAITAYDDELASPAAGFSLPSVEERPRRSAPKPRSTSRSRAHSGTMPSW
ncbi:hypothetical protein P9139_13775 [Curtobacterium flaccumfaciens]|nr:hypothetical protein P9139_13775 [Curtobacterium flaccumfaciens]